MRGKRAMSRRRPGVLGLTKSVAEGFGSRGLRVNAIAPGFIETDMTSVLPEAVQTTYRSRIPLGRFGAADEVARTALFLASDDASYITGQTLAVDGGLTMR